MKTRLERNKTAVRIASLALIAGMAGALPARAAIIGFELELNGDINAPTFALTNTSDSALIDNFQFTIGDTTRNFDAVGDAANNFATLLRDGTVAGASLVTPDANFSGGVRSDFLEIAFASFLPGILVSFEADVDADSINTGENFQTVFFNNGAALNSVASVLFSTGDLIELALQENPQQPFVFRASRDVGPPEQPPQIPVPASGWLVMGGLLGLIGAARLRSAPGGHRGGLVWPNQ